jgi:hypothetical protein
MTSYISPTIKLTNGNGNKSIPPLSVYKAWVDTATLSTRIFNTRTSKFSKDNLPRYLRNAVFFIANDGTLTEYCRHNRISYYYLSRIFKMMPESLKTTTYYVTNHPMSDD